MVGIHKFETNSKILKQSMSHHVNFGRNSTKETGKKIMRVFEDSSVSQTALKKQNRIFPSKKKTAFQKFITDFRFSLWRTLSSNIFSNPLFSPLFSKSSPKSVMAAKVMIINSFSPLPSNFYITVPLPSYLTRSDFFYLSGKNFSPGENRK